MNKRQKKKRYKKMYGYNPHKIGVDFGAGDSIGIIKIILIEPGEESCIRVAKILRERRKRCRQNRWRASGE